MLVTAVWTAIDVEGLPVAPLGATGVLILVALMVYTGRLVPRSQVDERVTDLKTERDTWREAWQTSEETRKVVADLLADLVDASKVTLQILDALPRDPPTRKDPREGPG